MPTPTRAHAGAAHATTAHAATAAESLRVGGVALRVRDLDRVEAFYRDVLGLRVTERAPGVVRLGAGDPGFLTLLHRPDARPDDPAGAGLYHTAFLLPSRAHLAAWLAHAGALRAPLTGASDHAVSEAVYLDDPEGNGVEVYADRPRDAWLWRDGEVEMTTHPLDVPGLLREAAPRGGSGSGSWDGAPAGTRIGHVHLRVGDVAQAVRFYTGRLGFDPVGSRAGAVFLSTGGYHHHVAVNVWHSAGAGPREPDRAGLDHVALEAAGAAVLDALAARTGAPDFARDGLRDPWGTALRVRVA